MGFLSIFTAGNFPHIESKYEAMADEVGNAGAKGYCLLVLFLAFLLFVILVVGIYQYNFRFLN